MKYIITNKQYQLLSEQVLTAPTTGVQSGTYAGTTSYQHDFQFPNDEKKIEYCKKLFNDTSLNSAKSFWINWLKNPTTLQKYMKNWGMTKEQVSSIFNDYISAINKVKVEYYVNDDDESTIAYVQPGLMSRLFKSTSYMPINVNCGTYVISKNNSVEAAVQTFIHEMQHILNEIHPWNPAKTNNTKTKTSSSYLTDLVNSMSTKKVSTPVNIIVTKMIKDGFEKKAAERLAKVYVDDVVNGDYESYVKNTNEIASRILEFRRILNKQPGQDITPRELAINGKTNSGFWLIMGYLLSDLSLNEFLQQINSHARLESSPDKTGTSTQV
jgi:hypothetical protein